MKIQTERLCFRKPEFWQRKHPALSNHYHAIVPRIKHPRRLRPEGKAYRYICNVEDVPQLIKAGYMVRIETFECDGPWSKLRMTFVTTNAKPGTTVEVE